jgi:tripartite-type tricarboxylate transporter receptor subunit TctC
MDQLFFGRRHLLASLALTATGTALGLPNRALASGDYPLRPIKLVAGAPGGGAGDVVARMVFNEVSKLLGQTFVVENKPGADGIIAASTVVNAKPDGYTLLFNYTSHVTNPSLRQQPFDTLKDFTPISMIATNWNVLVVRADHPAKTVMELVALAKKKPGALSVGFLPGSITHLSAEMLFSETGIDVLRVPYKANAEALKDLAGGQIDFCFMTVPPILALVQKGTLRALAVTDSTKSDLLPNVPLMSDIIPGFTVTGWYGLVGPKALPTEIVTKLNQAIRTVLSDPQLRNKMLQQGSQPAPMKPEEFGAFIASEIPRWDKVIRAAKIK